MKEPTLMMTSPPDPQPPSPRRFVGPKPGSLEAAQLLHDGIVVQPRRPQAKPPPRAAQAESARPPRRHGRVQRRVRKSVSARATKQAPKRPFKFSTWRYDDGTERPVERPVSRYIHNGAVFGFTDMPDAVKSARLAGRHATRRSGTKSHPETSAPPKSLLQYERAGQIRRVELECENSERSRARWAAHTVRISGIELCMASDLAVRGALAPLGNVVDSHVKLVTHDVFGRELNHLSWALVTFVHQESAKLAIQRTERAIVGCRETLNWKFDPVEEQTDDTVKQCNLEPEPEPELEPRPAMAAMEWDDVRLPIADALRQARRAYREGSVSRAVDIVDDFINEHPVLTSEQRSQVRSLYSALLAQQAVTISSTRPDGQPLPRSPAAPRRKSEQDGHLIQGDSFPAYQSHDTVHDVFKSTTSGLPNVSPRQPVVSLESELFEKDFERPTAPPRTEMHKGRKGRRPFSIEHANNQSKITGLYSEAQQHARAAINGGMKKAAPYLRKAVAEAALGAHVKSMKTANDGLSVAPNDPKLIRRFQAGYHWVTQDRYYRNEIHRPRPVYMAANTAVEEVVVEEKGPRQRKLQEMPGEWRLIDIMDLLHEQEKIMKSFDDVFAIPVGEVEDLDAMRNVESHEATVWIGNVPMHLVQSGNSGKAHEFSTKVMEQLGAFGSISACRVRRKEGLNKSWALCTFSSDPNGESAASIAKRLVDESIEVPGKDGKPMALKIKHSNVHEHLKKSSGALAMMAISQAAPAKTLQPVSTQTILRVLRCVNDANPSDMGSGSRSLTMAEYRKFKSRVEQALYTKGTKGGVRMLDVDDIHLLYSLRPADPRKDFDGIMDELNAARGFLKVVFKLYCMEGASSDKGIEGMGKNQFGVFCDVTELDEDGEQDGGHAIPLATIDRIFIRANYDRSAESAFQLDSPDGAQNNGTGRKSPLSPVAGRKSPSSPDNAASPPKTKDDDTSQMNLVEFVAACVRLAYHRYRDPSITERVHKFMQLLAQNPCFSAIDDEVCRRMATSEELEGIFIAHEQSLRQAFAKAASLNDEKEMDGGKAPAKKNKKSKMSKRGAQKRGKNGAKAEAKIQSTINLDEWIAFLNMYGLLNAKLTMREARMIFVQTNLDDELWSEEWLRVRCSNWIRNNSYVQEDGNDASQIVYDEFLECIVRCGIATYDYEFKVETDIKDFEVGNKSAAVKRKDVDEGGEAIHEAMARWGILRKHVNLMNLVQGGFLADAVLHLTAMKRVENQPDATKDDDTQADGSHPVDSALRATDEHFQYATRGAFEEFIDAYIQHEFLAAVQSGGRSASPDKDDSAT